MNAFYMAILVTAMLLIITGFFMLVRTRNMIRVIIAIEVVMKAVTLLLAFAGHINGQMALAQSFIITMIVVEVVIAVVAAGITICVYRKTGHLDMRNLDKLNG